ncbi:MAG: (4Fe-4S)-binding protein, partial [Roseibium sp.]
MPDTKLLLCDCLKSQSLNVEAIEKTTGIPCSKVYTELCRKEAASAAEALEAGPVVIACQQERDAFQELAEELGVADPIFVDIRDRAGWTADSVSTAPKMAALIADALLPEPGARVVDVISAGTCLILGDPEPALDAAAMLCDSLSVTVLMAPDAEPPVSDDRRYDVVRGRIRSATGALGRFKLSFDALQERLPGG